MDANSVNPEGIAELTAPAEEAQGKPNSGTNWWESLLRALAVLLGIVAGMILASIIAAALGWEGFGFVC